MPDLTALNTFAAYWVLATWVVGAFVIALALGMAAVWLGSIAIDKWWATTRHYRMALWVYQAMRAYERSGNRRPMQEVSMAPRNRISEAARALVHLAKSEGMVVTIETMPLAPLAMGNYYMQHDVREARSAQPAQAGADRAG